MMLHMHEYVGVNGTYQYPKTLGDHGDNRNCTLEDAYQALAMWTVLRLADEPKFAPAAANGRRNYEAICWEIYAWSWIIWALENPRKEGE